MYGPYPRDLAWLQVENLGSRVLEPPDPDGAVVVGAVPGLGTFAWVTVIIFLPQSPARSF